MGVDELEIQLFLGGITLKQNYAGKSLTVEEADIHRGDNTQRCIHLVYKTPVESRPADTDAQDHINHLIFKHATPLPRLVALLLLAPTQVLGIQATLNDQRIKARGEARSMPANLYSLAEIFARPADTNYEVGIRHDAWALLERLIAKYPQHPDKKKLDLPLGWIEKGTREYFSPDRLVAFWVAFNALYADSGSEQKQIINYMAQVSKPVLRQLLSELDTRLEELSKYGLKLRNNHEPSKALRNALQQSPQDERDVFKEAILCIYAIRNHLFHGSINLEDPASRTQIEVAEATLARILRAHVIDLLGERMLSQNPIASSTVAF